MRLPVSAAIGDNGHDFNSVLLRHRLKLAPVSISTLQVNITRLCNQACSHCHVAASPQRKEHMSRRIVDRCLEILARHDGCLNLDITGGAPELNPDFDYLVAAASKLKKRVMVRHNLTVTLDGNPETGENKEHLPEFFAEHRVEVNASLPHYQKYLTDRQRGRGVFKKSIEALRRLNAQGYGQNGTGLMLNLVHTAAGTLFPADQSCLEAEFKRELRARYGLVFNRLYTITNMPINRFWLQLQRSGSYDSYMAGLADAFNPRAAREVMCRSLISISPSGDVYDCDFNQMLGLPIGGREPVTVFNFDLDALMKRDIMFARHCFGCAAAAGST